MIWNNRVGHFFFSSGVFHVLMTVVFGFHRFHQVLIIPTRDSAFMWPAKKPVQIIIYIMSQRIFLSVQGPLCETSDRSALNFKVRLTQGAHSSWINAERWLWEFIFPACVGRRGTEVQRCGHNKERGVFQQGGERKLESESAWGGWPFLLDNNEKIRQVVLLLTVKKQLKLLPMIYLYILVF